MKSIREDLYYEVIENFDEYIVTTTHDTKMITNRLALFQALRGEIKTPKGECKGVGLEDYGCDIWKILGQNLTQLVVDQACLYIEELGPKYDEIIELKVSAITEQKKGRLIITMRIKSIFGDFEEDVIIDYERNTTY